MIRRLWLRAWLPIKHFVRRRDWIVRHVGGESREVWKIGPLCVKRWRRCVRPVDVRERCRRSRVNCDFAKRWYLPWLHWSIGLWIHGRRADYVDCQRLAWRHKWAGDIAPQNVVISDTGPKVIDFEVDTVRVALGTGTRWLAWLPGGGESRDIWRIGPVCLKRWSPRVSAAEVRMRCRVSRACAGLQSNVVRAVVSLDDGAVDRRAAGDA